MTVSWKVKIRDGKVKSSSSRRANLVPRGVLSYAAVNEIKCNAEIGLITKPSSMLLRKLKELKFATAVADFIP